MQMLMTATVAVDMVTKRGMLWSTVRSNELCHFANRFRFFKRCDAGGDGEKHHYPIIIHSSIFLCGYVKWFNKEEKGLVLDAVFHQQNSTGNNNNNNELKEIGISCVFAIMPDAFDDDGELSFPITFSSSWWCCFRHLPSSPQQQQQQEERFSNHRIIEPFLRFLVWKWSGSRCHH